MKTRFNLFRRAGVFYTEDTATGKQTSLRTRDESEAKSLLNARNEAQRQPVLNLHLVRTYRLMPGIAGRVRLSDEIFVLLEPLLLFKIYRKAAPQDEKDVLQETMKAVAESLNNFKGQSHDDFMKWCRGIARHKVHDYYHSRKIDRMQPLPPEELWPMVDASAQKTPMSAGDRIDFEDAMKLLPAFEGCDLKCRPNGFGLARFPNLEEVLSQSPGLPADGQPWVKVHGFSTSKRLCLRQIEMPPVRRWPQPLRGWNWRGR